MAKFYCRENSKIVRCYALHEWRMFHPNDLNSEIRFSDKIPAKEISKVRFTTVVRENGMQEVVIESRQSAL